MIMSERYRTDTAIIGMWLFLATEILFFGALFFVFLVCRQLHPAAMDQGVRRTDLTIGTVNSALLLTSGVAVLLGVRHKLGYLLAAALLGVGFLTLKGFEYAEDFRQGLFPGPAFVAAPGDALHQPLFFVCYFIATAIHALHLLIGLALIAYAARRAMRGNWTPATVVALYWGFVDIVWICLYPLLYLVGR